MAVELAVGYISLVPTAKDIGSAIEKELDLDRVAQEQGKSAGDKLSGGLLSGAQDSGKKLAAALGLAAVGALAAKSALDVEGAQNTIIRSTGATGKAADGLEASFRNVASGTAASFDTVATTLSELYQRTGLQGKALEGLTSQVVTFNRITKDSPVTVDALTKALAGFNVPAQQMGAELDHLFIISQKTGVPLAELLTTVQTAGPIARQFGLNVDQTASFLGNLNKAGLDANTIIPGLKRVLTDAAAAGKDPADALREVVTQIDALVKKGDEIGARALAVQIFGPRGAGLIDAALSGKLSLKSLNDQIDVTGDGIVATAGKTGTLSGAMGVLSNNVKLAFAGFATPALNAANDALRGILPTVKDLSAEFQGLPDGIKVGAVAAVGLVLAIGKIGEIATNVGPGLASMGELAATGLQLAAVRGLELLDTFRALSATQLLIGGGIGLAVGAAVALSIALAGDTNRLTEAEAAAKRWASSTLAAAKSSADEYTRVKTTIEGLKARQRELADEHGFLNDKVQLTEAVYGRMGAAVERDAKEFLANKDRIAELTPEFDKLITKKRDDAAATRETRSSLKDYNADLTAGKDATAAFAGLTEEGKKAVQDFQDALLAASGGAIGYQQQLVNQQKAQEAYNGAVLIFGADSREAAAAALDLQSANLQGAAAAKQLDDKNRQLITGLRDGTISYEAQRAALEQQIRLHPEQAAGIQLEIQKLEDAKFWADVLSNTHPQISVDVWVKPFEDALREAGFPTTGDAGFDFFTLFAAGGPLALHGEGGIFTRPHVGVVAEAGAEAILPLDDPNQAWQILAQTDLVRALPSPAAPAGSRVGPLAAGDVVFNGPVADPARAIRETTESLRAAMFLVGV